MIRIIVCCCLLLGGGGCWWRKDPNCKNGNFHIVPVSGLIVGALSRYEVEHRTALEQWVPNACIATVRPHMDQREEEIESSIDSLCRLVSLLCLMMFGPVVKYPEETLPLHQAISEGNVAAAKDIVDQAIIDVNNKDSHGYTALHLAASLKSNKEADLRIAVRHGSHTHRAISLSLSFAYQSISLFLCVCSSATFCFAQSESTCWLEMTRRILLSTTSCEPHRRWRSEEITLMCSRRW